MAEAQPADKAGIVVDKEKKTVTIDCKIAPRKLEYLKGEIYPLEVIRPGRTLRGRRRTRRSW